MDNLSKNLNYSFASSTVISEENEVLLPLATMFSEKMYVDTFINVFE